MQQRIVWPIEDRTAALGTGGRIGVLGGGAVAAGAVVAALLIGGSGGSGSDGGTTAVAVVPSTSVVPKAAPAPKPKKKAAKPAGPTLHGAPPDFSPAQDVKAGVGDSKAVEKAPKASGSADAPAERGAATGAGDTPAATARIGASPAASAAAEAQASSLATSGGAGARVAESSGSTGAGIVGSGSGETGSELTGPPAPKAAKQTARRFAEAFVVYEVGGVDGKVRSEFRHTTTRQLSRSLLQRPPRQPAAVKVPQAKVVNVVAGPSQGTVYSVSVSLLRVGATSELRLELEQGPGKKWQVTNVLG
ncbi:MAG TPA: hypothetical protein VIJ21_05545 [Solirubrobacterales bacterium]